MFSIRLNVLERWPRLKACSEQQIEDLARAKPSRHECRRNRTPSAYGGCLLSTALCLLIECAESLFRVTGSFIEPGANAARRAYARIMSGTSDYETEFEAKLSPRELEQWRQMKAQSPRVESAEALRLRRRREAWERAAREYVDGSISAAELVERAGSGT